MKSVIYIDPEGNQRYGKIMEEWGLARSKSIYANIQLWVPNDPNDQNPLRPMHPAEIVWAVPHDESGKPGTFNFDERDRA